METDMKVDNSSGVGVWTIDRRKRSRENVLPEDEIVFVYYEHTELSSIPKGIDRLRIDKSVRKIPANAFRDQYDLTNVEYEEGLEVIGERAFSDCISLREQHFPSTLVEIGEGAFWECRCLKSVGRLPLSLTIIRKHAFCLCRGLKRVEIHDGIRLEQSVFHLCTRLSYCRLPRGMVTIPKCLFFECSSLVDVQVPSSVIAIGDGAFMFCSQLNIELPTGLRKVEADAFVRCKIKDFHCLESIGAGALRRCRSLESAILPPKLEVIADWTFERCCNLKDILIPQSVARVGLHAFACTGLIHLDFSRCTITSIGAYAFAYCSNLMNIILPRTSLQRIEEMTFRDCRSLTHLWIPPTVKYVDKGAFGGCTSLISVEVPETVTRVVFITEDYDEDFGPTGERLCGYQSLVNVYIPPSNQLDEVEDYEFMDEMKLGQVDGNYEELVDKLKRRFNFLPLHLTCYFQSYHSLQENVRRIRSIVAAGPRACDRVDFLGMTPFHILALSHRPWLNLFQELLPVSSVDIMSCRDVFGATPLDYLCKNHSPQALHVTKSLLLHVLEPRISLLGLDGWRNDVMSGLEEVQLADATILGDKVKSVCEKLKKLERMEVLSLLEMSIWKMKMEEEKATRSDARESCRISCGSNIVLEHVVPFLESVQVIDDDDDGDQISYDETDDGDY